MTPGAPHQECLAHSPLIAIDDHTENPHLISIRHSDYPS